MKAVYDAPAPAKLNLFLHIVGRRADGYHLLQSAFQLVDWCDTLHFERRADGRLARHDLGDPLPADDLCLRAARALQSQSGTAFGCEISIEKRLPSGAGMGGGSSDAATTLLVLNKLWQLDWPRERLAALALSLGADVPFFVGGRNAWVEGIGERIAPIELPERSFAVVKPAASLDTRSVFASRLVVRDTPAATISGFVERECALSSGWGRNDLQPAAEAQCPQVRQAARWLEQRWGNSRMTGSGSAVYARITEDFDRSAGIGASPSATGLPELPAGWVGRRCRSLPRHPLCGWAADR